MKGNHDSTIQKIRQQGTQDTRRRQTKQKKKTTKNRKNQPKIKYQKNNKKQNHKRNTICVGHHYSQMNTTNVNKI